MDRLDRPRPPRRLRADGSRPLRLGLPNRDPGPWRRRSQEAARRPQSGSLVKDQGRFHGPDGSSPPILPLRAWNALRSRGPQYAWHKVLRRSLGRWPAWKRRWLYADPRAYWTLRGGDDYFREQEGQEATDAPGGVDGRPAGGLPADLDPRDRLRLRQAASMPCARRTRRPAGRRRLQPDSARPCSRRYLEGIDGIDVLLAGGDRLPFADGAFDMVVTSAVILHNPPGDRRAHPPRGAPGGPTVRRPQRRDGRQLQPLRLRHGRLVSRARVSTSPSRDRSRWIPTRGPPSSAWPG